MSKQTTELYEHIKLEWGRSEEIVESEEADTLLRAAHIGKRDAYRYVLDLFERVLSEEKEEGTK